MLSVLATFIIATFIWTQPRCISESQVSQQQIWVRLFRKSYTRQSSFILWLTLGLSPGVLKVIVKFLPIKSKWSDFRLRVGHMIEEVGILNVPVQLYRTNRRHAEANLAEALRYTSEGCGFDSRWGKWLNLSGLCRALGSTQPLTEILAAFKYRLSRNSGILNLLEP